MSKNPTNHIDAIDYHRGHPEIPVWKHLETLQTQLGKSVETSSKVYLDTNYWIALRDVFLERSKNALYQNLHDVLVKLVRENSVICPISESTFYEIVRQTDKQTLAASLQLIDELSGGISLLSSDERIAVELRHFFTRYLPNVDPLPLKTQVWTKLAFTIGTRIPTRTSFDKSEELVVQKSFIDYQWPMGLLELTNITGTQAFKDYTHYPGFALLMNNDFDERKSDVRSYHQAFLSEVEFQIEMIEPTLKEVFARIFFEQTGSILTESEATDSETFRLSKNAIYNIFRLRKQRDNLPSIHVGAALRAAIWWDKTRKFKQNDFLDIEHAQAAIPYCDFFFTEKNIQRFVTSGHLRLEEKFDCNTASDPSAALDLLKVLDQ